MSCDEAITWATYESPIGPLTATAGASGLRTLRFPGDTGRVGETARRPMPKLFDQLDAYFAGSLEAFDIDLELRGNTLEKLAWEQLLEIPYGQTTTYGQLARRIDDSAYPDALELYERPRLVGAAIGRNPVPIVVACHRVIGADGSLTGYRGGLERKRALLELEGWTVTGRVLESSRPSPQLGLLAPALCRHAIVGDEFAQRPDPG